MGCDCRWRVATGCGRTLPALAAAGSRRRRLGRPRGAVPPGQPDRHRLARSRFTNAGLADDATARFLFRELVSPAVSAGQPVAFDEIERSAAAGDPGTPNVEQLLFQTPAGRAVLYAALLVFVFLLLAGRRLGPPVYLRAAPEAPRTMYEHVQMLANLYRRARPVERGSRRVQPPLSSRAAPAGPLPPARAATLADGLARVDSARTESDLVAAVGALEDAR